MKGVSPDKQHSPIAIIGMDCLFPNAQGLHEYWRVIRHGEDCISDVPTSHWKISDYCTDDPDLKDMITCRRGAFLSETTFDPVEFGIPPTVLEATDTAQLLGLAVAKRALKDAGYDNGRVFDRSRVGVIVGVTGTQELVLPLGARLGHPLWRQALRDAGVSAEVAERVVKGIADGYVDWQENSFPGLLGNVVAGRIANRLDLHGTNCVVDAACASSLSAIHMASLELAGGQTDMVVTGGVDTLNDIFMFMCFHKAQALSPSGDARPFSKDADGTVIGDGVGMLVLKRLADAQRDGDKIYAVLKGIGTSSDGRSQSIYAPHAPGQARALRCAYEVSGVDPCTIELVEAHGTGTKVGDVTEFEALKTVYREAQADGQWCSIGSVKSQIGHTKAAAGAASMIKTVLALYQRVLPATIKVDEPNPKLGIEDSPFYVGTETRPWLSDGEHPRRAAVSSFGFGGSNFHAVLEEYAGALHEPAWDGSVEIIALSATDAAGLQTRLDEWDRAAVDGLDSQRLASLASRSRREFVAADSYRLVLVHERGADLGKLVADTTQALRQKGTSAPWQLPNIYFGATERPGKLALLFPGQGSQYVNMGRDLACHFPAALDAINEAGLEQADAGGLGEQIYPRPTFDPAARTQHEELLRQTEVTQPALGAVSLAMLRILKTFGIEADFAAGHSFGELVALRAAGRIGDEALRTLARLRGMLMGQAKDADGAMMAVSASLEEIDKLLEAESGDDVVLANRNTPTQGIVSGVRKAVERIGKVCEQRGWRTKMLQVSAAFHSKFMAPAQEKFRAALDEVVFELGRIPVLSNVTAALYPDDPDKAKDLLAKQLTHPVNFVEQIKHLYEAGARTFVEVGPKNVLTGLVRNILQGKTLNALAVDAGLGRGNGVLDLARCLALLTALGYAVEIQAWERPAPEVVEPKMPVPLCGANYRKPATRSPEINIPTDTIRQQEVGNTSMNNVEPGGAAGAPAPAPAVADAGQLAQAFQVVQEGLRAMQALQQQTAAAHERFLHTQEHAHKTFQMVIAQQQQLVAGALSLSPGSIPMPVMEQPIAAPPPPPAPIAPAPPLVAPGVPAAVPTPAGSNGDSQPAVAPAPITAPAPPATPEPIAASGNGDGQTASGNGDFNSIVLEAVSELTGYPTEMLDLDMDMEADLGIDSIKRLEILGAVQKKVPEMAEVNSQYMGSLRTLRNIIDYAKGAGEEAASGSDPTSAPASSEQTSEQIVDEREVAKLERRVLTEVELSPAKQRPLRIAKGHEVWVTDDGTPLAPTLVKRLEKLGCAARVIGPRGGWRGTEDKQIGGLIVLGSPGEGDCEQWNEATEAELKDAFKRVKLLAPNLKAAAEAGGALLATVARLDGAFGLRGGSFDALQGGFSGLAKTAAHELEGVACRALDVVREWQDIEAVADAIADELAADGPVEVGLGEGRRIGLELTDAALEIGDLPLDDGDVVVVSGGARGVTAETVLVLTQRKRLVLVLLGRSPEPEPEPQWLAGCEDEATIKQVLLANAFNGTRPKPKELEAEFRRAMANREVTRNLERIRATGATVYYRAVDVRDAEEIADVLDEVRDQHGPVRGVIHAAGVLADHLIEDKTPEQFDAVFDTKVHGLRALLEATGDDELKCLVLFSSVSGRFGRVGQVDYAMANEVLNKVAQFEARERPECRVVSLNWGPWDGGMVTPGLKQEFTRLGIELIPLRAGAKHMLDELCATDGGAVEVVVGGSFPDAAPPEPDQNRFQPAVSRNGDMSVAFERVLDLETHPFLRSHVIDGKPVLPMAVMLEWLGHGALHDNPGLLPLGLDDFRVLKGVILDGEPKTVRVHTSRAKRDGATFVVETELRSTSDDREIIHARGKALLAEELPAAPEVEDLARLREQTYGPGINGAYGDVLFHGPHFQAIENVLGISEHGIMADARSGSSPGEWMDAPLRSSWIGDPLALDVGLQLGILWSRERMGAVSLPSFGARYRQYRSAFPSDGVRIALEVIETGPQRLAATLTFIDGDGVIARYEGCEWTVDPSLGAAFSRRELVGA